FPVTAILVAIAFGGPGMLEARAQTRPATPQGPAGTVNLPVADDAPLLDRAAQPAAAIDTPPVASVVGRAELRGRVAGGVVLGTVRIEGEIFQRDPVRVPLITGATLLDARTDGQPLP